MHVQISIELLTILMFGSLAVLLMAGLPLAFVTGGLACVFLVVFGDMQMLNILPSRIFPMMTNYQLSAIPLFIFMASMLERAGRDRGAVRRRLQGTGRAQGRPGHGHHHRLHHHGRHGGRDRRHRGHHGHSGPAGHAAAGLRSAHGLRLHPRRRHSGHPHPAVHPRHPVRGGGPAIRGRAVPGRGGARPAAFRVLHALCHGAELRQSRKGPGTAGGGPDHGPPEGRAAAGTDSHRSS